MWMLSCWSSQRPGCLCIHETVGEDTVTFLPPKMGGCPDGTGPLNNPEAKNTGGVALQCTENPCIL